MHIGIDARLPYYQMGGISRYVLQLIRALSELEVEEQYTIFQSWKDPQVYRPDGPNFHRRTLLTPCHHRIERWTLGLELSFSSLDVMHSPDFVPPAFGARRYIVTVHDLNFLYYPQFLTEDSRRYYTDQIRWAVRKADHIAADSEHTRQDLLQHLGVKPSKVTTIPLAADPIFAEVPTEGAIQSTLARFNLPSGFILFVGTLEPRKNLPTLLRAYKQLLREKLAAVPLVLVGRKGWLYDEIFNLVDALKIERSVLHLDRVSNVELAHLYRAAAVLALPSHYEGFGFPPLEAMHCSCPVIVSNRASLPEVVGDAALVLEANDIDAWSEALERVLDDSRLRARMVAGGHEQAARFSWEKTAQATWRLYRGKQ